MGFESNLGIDVDEESEESEDIAHEKLTTEILVPGTIVALAAEKKSVDTFYLIKITMEECTLDGDVLDDYGHKLRCGQPHLEGNFLEKICGSMLSDDEFVQITQYIEDYGLTAIF